MVYVALVSQTYYFQSKSTIIRINVGIKNLHKGHTARPWKRTNVTKLDESLLSISQTKGKQCVRDDAMVEITVFCIYNELENNNLQQLFYT